MGSLLHPIANTNADTGRIVASPSRAVTTNATDSSSNRPNKCSLFFIVQEMYVYEINELDRDSSAYLSLSQKPVNSLLPFSNKIVLNFLLYHGNLEKRLGITAGIGVLIRHVFYFGDYGHISVQGLESCRAELLREPVRPHPDIEPTPSAKAAEPHASIPNYAN
ncbi:hypothetical protein AMTRI_Chr08g204880 [Amborella trichopoda]